MSSFLDALRREFEERMIEWARLNRPQMWARFSGDPLTVWREITETESAEVRTYSPAVPPPDRGELWCLVAGKRILGVEWEFEATGKLVRIQWYGFDPHAHERKGPCSGQGQGLTSRPIPGSN
jgi:hypothetical protein